MTIRRWHCLVAVAAMLAFGGQIGWQWRNFRAAAARHTRLAAMFKARANARLAILNARLAILSVPINGDPVAMSVEDGLRQIEMAKRSSNVYLGDYAGPPFHWLTIEEAKKLAEKEMRLAKEEMLQATAQADPVLAHYLSLKRHHRELSQKYLRAAGRPWLAVSPDPPVPER
jgi:hypothetical protein